MGKVKPMNPQIYKLPTPEQARKLWKPLPPWGKRGKQFKKMDTTKKHKTHHPVKFGRTKALSSAFETNRRKH